MQELQVLEVTFNPQQDPLKWRAELEAKDRKIIYLEEQVRSAIEQQKKWQKKAFETKDQVDKWMKLYFEMKDERDNEKIQHQKYESWYWETKEKYDKLYYDVTHVQEKVMAKMRESRRIENENMEDNHK